jgi:hypothetical protein
MTNEELITLASIINNTFDGHIANAIVIPEQKGVNSMFTLTIAGRSVTFDSKLNCQEPKEMRRRGSTCGTLPGTVIGTDMQNILKRN